MPLNRQMLLAFFETQPLPLSFRVGSRAAQVLAEQLGANLQPSDFTCLRRFTAYLRLLVNGSPSQPFSIRTLAPPNPITEDIAAKVRRISHGQYGRKTANQVEQEIARAYAA